MDLNEFEIQYRDTIEQSINQLQAAVLLLTQLSRVEANVLAVGQNLQTLSQTVEEFITQQRTE
ncbi:MAG: hypothetical protein JOZ78_13410 [Chroococcidiopsidaceae cyanobacterium CP_BM_ER_R8_30]|nr:hypothetical protein [Chroococcidiopsidaceae cyanobacterium CP_BM_ER_R8_30]